MPLTNVQYQEIMREYDQRRVDNYELQQQHKREVYRRIPQIKELDQKIAHIAIALGKQLVVCEAPDKVAEFEKEKESLRAQKIELLTEHGYSPDYLEPIYTCKDCKDTGYINNQKCHCFQQAIIHHVYSTSNLDTILLEDNFQHFRKDFYSEEIPKKGLPSPRQNIESVLDVCHRFINHFPCGDNLLFTGSTGVGKTFLTHCIAKEIMDLGYPCVYVTAFQLFDILASHTFQRAKDMPLPITFDLILNSDLLIIDDLGTELNNSFVSSQLFQVTNERLIKKKSTIISTNLTLEKLRNQYTDRIFSRIVEGYSVCKIYGEDIRFKKSFSS